MTPFAAGDVPEKAVTIRKAAVAGES